jgi:hypothetical protein
VRVTLGRNLTLKIFSLLLAIVCWYVAGHEELRLVDFTVPVDYVNLPPEFALGGEIVDRVSVRLRGTEANMKTVSGSDLVARIDLSQVLLGEQHIPLTPQMIRAPRGAEVARLVPDLLPLRVEKMVRRTVPIVAEFHGTPPRGFEKVRHSIEPPEVEIEGPSSEVGKVERALAGTIHLNGETTDYYVTVTPIPDAPAGSRVRIAAPLGPVRVHILIRPAAPPAPAAETGKAGRRPRGGRP